ncbi:MAG TPA: hypothetical protein VF701_05645 [Thermoanaerobaculia bacterium]
MPVFKYRSIEEMPEASQHFEGRNTAGRLRFVLETVRFAPPRRLPRGVRKFRGFEEMAADRDRSESAS